MKGGKKRKEMAQLAIICCRPRSISRGPKSLQKRKNRSIDRSIGFASETVIINNKNKKW